MGLPANSLAHDAELELAAHWIVDKYIQHSGCLPASLEARMMLWLRGVQATRSYQRPHARTTSPHRFAATAWEALMVDWRQNKADPTCASALVSVCVRIITATLDDEDRLTPFVYLAYVQALEVRALFDAEAGLVAAPHRPASQRLAS